MKRVYLDGRAMSTPAAAHEQIARALAFPGWYGGNLDALWDLLGETSADVLLGGADAMLASLGEYGARLLQVFFDVDRENPEFAFHIDAGFEGVLRDWTKSNAQARGDKGKEGKGGQRE